uniref:Uncharacterized protein n=1 Tax=Rhizophora mucronata TaxID=61149 RepID=A0A2P2N7J7_RHIMU
MNCQITARPLADLDFWGVVSFDEDLHIIRNMKLLTTTL